MKIEVGEEISKEEYYKLPDDERIFVHNHHEKKFYYFKKAQKFPIVFEDDDKKITLEKRGIEIRQKNTDEWLYFSYINAFPLLVKAVEKAKEVVKKNEN